MLFIKILGCVLIIGSSTGMGFLFGSEIKKRIEDLKSAKTFAILLSGDIRYAKTALPEALSNVARRHEGRLGPFLKKVAKELDSYSGTSLYEIWKRAVKEELSKTSLTAKDKENLLHLGESLGNLDKDTQVTTIEWYIAQVEEDMKAVSADAKEKIKLYRSLGVLAGIFVVVLII
ncbi:MAG: hypothetical protein E7256_15015 [Lachnospiraceae bacterium]|nr:hypothetical protein [Lachnospiraceae bacterium]